MFVIVYAKDGGIPPNFAKAKVHITVLDENDNAPAFGLQQYSLEVPENLQPVELFTLKATDLDTGESGQLEYKIKGKASDFGLFERFCVIYRSFYKPGLAYIRSV